jgi:uncharacterized protein
MSKEELLMSITFAELRKQLHLSKNYERPDQLAALEQWCNKHVSTEFCDRQDPTERYNYYLSLAHIYLDVFLKYVPTDISKKVRQFDHMDAIQFAAVHGYDRFIETTVPIGYPALDEQNDMGMTPLHLSVTSDNLRTLEALLAKGANPHIPNSESNLPIHSALFLPGIYDESILSIKEAMFKALINQAPDTITSKGAGGETIFHLMVANGFTHLLKECLSQHPEGVFYCNYHGHYPIHTAILQKNMPAFTFLLSKDKVATLADVKGQTALHYVARYGANDMLEACCKASLDLDIRDKDLQTPIMLAAAAGRLDAVKMLNDKGADTTLVDYLGRSVLHHAVLSKKNDLVVWVLNNTNVDVNQEDKEHKLAIDYCKSSDNEAIASALLSKGSKPAQTTSHTMRN